MDGPRVHAAGVYAGQAFLADFEQTPVGLPRLLILLMVA
ncbi:hypothetical protein M877_03295 [Streptomyces niveus NCIMB 11891]|nr:hypothetical protein M877_03295 [Streptomyces niveus NCIMB 11891]